MKVAFGFLVGCRLNHEALWQAYFNGAAATVLIHPHQGAYKGAQVAAHQVTVPTVRTTWRQTINGHYALYEAFLAATDATHLCILSESCIPIRPFAELRMALELEAGNSLMGRLCVPAWFTNGNPRTKRIIFDEMRPANASHEQWCILAREHVQCLVDNKKRVLSNFRNCFADNECFMGTALRFYGHGERLHNHLVTFTDWAGGANHPKKYVRVTEELLGDVPNECFFLRKVVPKANVAAAYARIGAEPVTPAYKAMRAAVDGLSATVFQKGETVRAADGLPRLAVFVHLWYLELWEELLRYLHNMPEPFDLYVNLAEGGDEARQSDLRQLAARIASDAPFAKVVTSPNEGRDVGGLFRLFEEVPAGRRYDAWLTLHGKRSPQYEAGHGDAWRGQLLDALLGTPDMAKRCLKELKKSNVGIVGSRKWLARDQAANGQLIGELCALMKCRNDRREYIGGTMFWADGRLLEAWRNSGLIQRDFAADPALLDGTLAHAWERAVSICARKLGLQTVGLHAMGRHLPPASPLKPSGPAGEVSAVAKSRFDPSGPMPPKVSSGRVDATPTGRPSGLMFGVAARPEPPPTRPSLVPACSDCITAYTCEPDRWSFARQMRLVNAWVINLARRPDKLATATATLEGVGIPFRRLEAVDADAMLIASQKPREVRHLTIGCTLSHRIILQMAVLNNWDSVAIFEDDLVPRPDFFEVAQAFLSELPDDWEFAWLGWTERHNRHRAVDGLAHVARHDDAMGTHAYAIRGREAIRKVYERSVTADDHWDIVLSALTRDWPTAYKSRRALFVQDAATSDIHPEQGEKMKRHVEWALNN